VEKCVGHSLKLLDTVRKIWAPLRKLFAKLVTGLLHRDLRTWSSWDQARRQDLTAGGTKTKKRGQKSEGGATFLEYNIGSMQQPGGQT